MYVSDPPSERTSSPHEHDIAKATDRHSQAWFVAAFVATQTPTAELPFRTRVADPNVT